jgi:hypothetical protein
MKRLSGIFFTALAVAAITFSLAVSLYGAAQQYGGGSHRTATAETSMSFRAYPESALALDASGNVYGTSFSGGEGTSTCHDGCGTVFEVKP